MEGVVLAMACLGPWAFGAVEPRHEFLMDVGVCALMALWGLGMVLEGRGPQLGGPVAACLAVMILIGVAQVVPMPGWLLSRASPSTASLYGQLLPGKPEVLPSGAGRDDPKPAAGSTLSFYPGATRVEVVRLLGLLLLFAAVGDSVASPASLRRLGLAALANGSLLALFGLVQFFSSVGPGLVYWTIPTAGHVFGPFVNRNHFAFYQNLCVGLAAGVLLARSADRPARPGPRRRGVEGGREFLVDLLRDPWSLGMMFALALMASSVVFTLSRGGFLALLGGALFGLAIWAPRSWRSIRGGPILGALATATALACWFGYEQVATRLATLHDPVILEDRRLAVLLRALPVIRDFPLFGTGYGTYEFADMLHRVDAADAGVTFDHAHDDYLEVLVEGGLAGLVPYVLAIALTLGRGLRAARGPAGGLALGASAGLAAASIHGFTDFGMHIPANAVMATILGAQVCALGRAGERPGPEGGRRPAGLGAALGAIVASALGAVLVAEGWSARRAQPLREAAFASGETFDRASRARKIAALAEATRVVPAYARLQAELAHAYLDDYRQPEAGRPQESALISALRHLLRSRDLCPLRAEAHLDLAVHAGLFASADPRGEYLGRAKLLAPDDPDLWFRCGELEIEDGRPDQAWESWRKSLALSARNLPVILDRASGLLGRDEVLRRVMPESPDRLLEAAAYLATRPPEERRPYLEKASALLKRREGPPSAPEAHLRATIDRSLGRSTEALAAYRSALAREPYQNEWRREMAELLYERGEYQESRQELLTILGLRPADETARLLLEEATRKIAEGK